MTTDTNQAWFTVEPIDNQTYAISEYGHWEQVHSYLFIGNEKGALIDSGTGPVAYAASIARLHALPEIKRLLPGHNQLDIPVNLLNEAHAAFQSLDERGLLHHGSGKHSFARIAIQL